MLQKIKLLCVAVFAAATWSAQAQSLDLNYVFRPSMKIGAEYTPEQSFQNTGDSLKFGLVRGNVQLVIPIKSRVQVSFPNLDVKAKQIFWNINAGYRQPQLSGLVNQQRHLYSFSTGITGVKVGLRSSFWFYNVSVGMSESENTLEKWKPTAGGFLAKIHVHNLKTAYVYGLGAFYSNGLFVPAPIFGVVKRFSKKSNFALILPAQIRYSYAPSKSVRLHWQISPSGLRAGFATAPDSLFGRKSERILFNYSQLRGSMGINLRFSKYAQLQLEGGWATRRRLTFADADRNTIHKYKINAGAYVGATLQLSLGKALLDSQNFGFDL